MNSNEKRMLLRASLKLMSAVAVIVTAAVMVAGMFGDGSDSGSAGLRVALADLAPGQLKQIQWGTRPVLILHRDAGMRASLATPHPTLRDPQSRWSQQPDGLPAQSRARQPSYFVAVAVGTDLGCALELLPAGGEFRGQNWPGGFKDSCRGSRYDLAGRVFDDQEAQRNLSVPDYRIDGQTLLLGE